MHRHTQRPYVPHIAWEPEEIALVFESLIKIKPIVTEYESQYDTLLRLFRSSQVGLPAYRFRASGTSTIRPTLRKLVRDHDANLREVTGSGVDLAIVPDHLRPMFARFLSQ